MKKLSLIIIIFVLAQIMTATTVFASAEKSFVSGTVWVDTNGNEIQELNESGMVDAMVYVQNLDTNEIATTTTDLYGNFVVSDLPFGRYVVWCDGEEGTTDTRVIELNEVTGAATLQLTIPQPEVDLLMSALDIQFSTIYLPIVTN